ncbi:MAG TPA: hypothetical protein VLH12_00555 [Usitatibacter sp.]|nr:hypothetical protein [Usitatibacter sp.]
MPLVLASGDANAQGDIGLGWLVLPWIVGFGGVFASARLHLHFSKAQPFIRYVQSIGWALLDVVIAFFGVVCVAPMLRDWDMDSSLHFVTGMLILASTAWILPAILFAWAHWRRKNRT